MIANRPHAPDSSATIPDMLRLRRHPLSPALTTLSAVGVFVLGGWLTQLALGLRGNRELAGTPEFTLWSALVAATVAVYVLAFSQSAPLALRWREISGVPLWQPLMIYAVLAALVLGFLWKANAVADLPPTTVVPISRTLTALGVIAVGPSVLGLWLAYTRLRRVSDLLDGRGPATPAGAVLTELLDCRDVLRRCLAVMSLIVSTAMIDAGALRKAFLAGGAAEDQFPAEAVLLYGSLFTGIFVLIYVPAFLAWRRRCFRLVDLLYPVPADARAGEEWTAGRTRQIQVLGADAGVAKNLTAAFGILAPLATSALSIAVPGLA